MSEQISEKVNELAARVLEPEQFDSFTRLPLKSRVFGILFFATIGGDTEMAEAAEKVYQQL